MTGEQLQVCTAEPVGGDGLIDPSTFPCRAHDLDTSKITDAAKALRTMGSTVERETSSIGRTWEGLKDSYEAPEQETVFELLTPAVKSATDLRSDLDEAAGHLDTYASKLGGMRKRLATFEAEAWEFRNRVKDGVMVPASEAKDASLGDHWDGLVSMLPGVGEERKVLVHWKEDTETVDRNTELLQEYGRIVAEISQAVADCANGINGLVKGQCIAEVEALPAEAFTNPEMPMPWGYPVEEDRNCPESVGHGVSSFGYGLYSGAASLVGYDTEEGRWGWDVAGQAWGGLGNFLGSTLVTMTFTPHLAQLGVPMPEGVRDWLTERGDVAAAGWSSLVGYDYYAAIEGGDGWHKWKEDGVAAGTESLLNVGTFFIPGAQVGSALKTGSAGARLMRVVAAGADFAVPGGSFALKGGVRFASGLRNAIRLGDDVPVNGGVSGVRFNPASLIDDVTDVPTPPVDRTPVSTDLFGSSGPRTPDVLPEGQGGARAGGVPEQPSGSQLPEQPSGSRTPEQPSGSQKPEQPTGHAPEEPAGQVPEESTGAAPEQQPGGHGPEQQPGGRAPEQPDGTPSDPTAGRAPEHPDSRPSDGTRPTEGRSTTEYDPTQPAPETISAKEARAEHGKTYTPEDVQQALDEAPVNSHGDPVDPRTGAPLLLERSDGARGWEMRWDPENERWVAQNHGNGEVSGLPPRGEPNSFGYDANGNRMPYANHRPSYGETQVQDVWDAAVRPDGTVQVVGPDGRPVTIEWTPGQPRDGVWDMGHRPDSKYSDLRDRYLNHEITLEEFLEEYRDPDNYQVEHPTVNRSHMNEDGSMDLAGYEGEFRPDADDAPARPELESSGDHGSPDHGGHGTGAGAFPAPDPQHPLAHLASEVAPGDPRRAVHAGSADPHTLHEAFRAEYQALLEVNADRYGRRAGHSNNCTRCVVAADRMLSGAPSSAMPLPKDVRGDLSAITNALGGYVQPVRGYGQIVDIMSTLPEGTRGVVAISRHGGPGHVFTVVHDRNGVVFLDAQTGRFATLESNVKQIDLIVVPNSAATTTGPPYVFQAPPPTTPVPPPPATPPAAGGGLTAPRPRLPLLADAAAEGTHPSSEEPR